MEANDGFPQTGLQKQVIFGIGRDNSNNPQEWSQRLKSPITGFTLGVTDFGNIDKIGLAVTAMPIIEFKAFGRNDLSLLSGLGISYFTQRHHPEKNFDNRAITTYFTWAFRMFFNYRVYSQENIDWRIGTGYSHHSNGHSRLMNNGLNSFLLNISAHIKTGKPIKEEEPFLPDYGNSVFNYFSIRTGFGQNVLSPVYNTRKKVYSFSGEYGRIYNNTYKMGLGFYYRFYEHYYQYIVKNESLTQAGKEFEHYRKHPILYATNLGISLNGEIILNHVGIDLQIGFNLYKPAYKIDWRINQGWSNTPQDIPDSWELGEYTSYFIFKYRVSSRLGLKYYLVGMEKKPNHNVYFGAHLNANLGQADFSELSLGYVYFFNFRKKL